MNILIALLFLLLYAVVALLVIQIVLWIVGLFIPVPPKIVQLLYAIVGVLLLIWIIQVLLGTTPIFPPPHRIP